MSNLFHSLTFFIEFYDASKKSKKENSKNFINFVPTTHFSPFNNLTNGLSLQQHQNSTTRPFIVPLINETANHIDSLTLNESRYPVYMDPLNETTRYPVNIYSSIIILYER